MATKFVIIGGGPAGHQAATYAARLGAEVTVVERDVIGGAANLWDCIPSKTMIATGGAMSFARRLDGMGLEDVTPTIDRDGLAERISRITGRLQSGYTTQLESQGIHIIRGSGRFISPHMIVAETADGPVELEFDSALISTGSRPRIPDWVTVDGDRILTTRECYPPAEIPKHIVVIGSGVTGVEFVHMFSSLGSQVTLVVSRQQVLPQKDPEVAAVLEDDFLKRGVKLLKGARAEVIERDPETGGVVVRCDDGRTVNASHAVLAIGSIPNTDGLGLDVAGVDVDSNGYVTINHHCVTNVHHIYAAGDASGKLPLASVAQMQGRKIAEHAMGLHTRDHRHLDYDKAASAIFTEPEIADVGLAETEAFAVGRKIRVTKVPFRTTPKALINDDPRGFVKIVSDPLTGVVLGGSIVGRHAAELISVIALAVTCGLKVSDIADSMLVHPALSEALAEAAE
jgi:NAD(P)H dehydrogenase (quinone)